MITRRDVNDLYRRYAHVIFRRCRALLGREEEAMDAMQEVFIRALRYGRGFRRDKKPLPWLFGIANRICFDRRRLLVRQGILRAEIVEVATGLDAEQKTFMLQHLEKFDSLTREIVLCYYLEEMTMEEISSHVGRSRKTVGKRLARFQKRSKEILTGREPES
jgi:RNA polymerase sigma-70 factor (ECF subfamily)